LFDNLTNAQLFVLALDRASERLLDGDIDVVPRLLAGAVQKVNQLLDHLELLHLGRADLDALAAKLLVVEQGLVHLILEHRGVFFSEGLKYKKKWY
jgi:hypothetical protein